MRPQHPSFPPDVAAALQRPAGAASVRYTLPARMRRPFAHRFLLMQTPHEDILAALLLDPAFRLRFVRTGSSVEPMRVVKLDVSALRGSGHWDIGMRWDTDVIELTARDQDDPHGPTLSAREPR